MTRFLLTVRKNYRPVAYHNFRHAFNVQQAMFAALQVRMEKSQQCMSTHSFPPLPPPLPLTCIHASVSQSPRGHGSVAPVKRHCHQ